MQNCWTIPLEFYSISNISVEKPIFVSQRVNVPHSQMKMICFLVYCKREEKNIKPKIVLILDVWHYPDETSILTSLEECAGACGLLMTLFGEIALGELREILKAIYHKMNGVSKGSSPPPEQLRKQTRDTVNQACVSWQWNFLYISYVVFVSRKNQMMSTDL